MPELRSIVATVNTACERGLNNDKSVPQADTCSQSGQVLRTAIMLSLCSVPTNLGVVSDQFNVNALFTFRGSS